MTRTTRLARYCSCGGSLVGAGRPARLVAAWSVMFDRIHTGPDHGPATQAQARAARRRDTRRRTGAARVS